jgi:hypothetical protein
MEANGEASKAPRCSKPRIFKAPQGHCLGQASSATSFVISQLALKQLEIAIRLVTPPEVHNTSRNSRFSSNRSGLRIAGEGV